METLEEYFIKRLQMLNQFCSVESLSSTILTAEQAIQFSKEFYENKKLKIEFEEYSYSCSDGCCTNYGTKTKVDGIELPLHNQDIDTIVTQILEHLGYSVEIENSYDYSN